ncbi:MAG: cyclase family protein [Bryobacteraceae bacterium]|nr:cyclase family protein [Bryobacteraceae bacterium]
MPLRCLLLITALCLALGAQPRGWQKGKGYGPVYGSQDEVGSLNAINTPAQVLEALRQVKTGRVFDLGVRVANDSFKFAGHAPTQITTYRSPEGFQRETGQNALAYHSCALFTSDNIGTQIDSLGHITRGADHRWYNGFREADHGSDFGIAKAGADTIPPIIGRAVMIDVAGWKGVDALPSNFAIGPKELQGALAAQKTDVQPGDIVLIRTGTLRYWGESGGDHAKIAQHDTAGLTLAGAKWLVEEKGAVMLGADTSGLEVGKDPDHPNAMLLVHSYLLVDQGVHIGEFHNLEALAAAKVYRFTYVAMTNRFKNATAGFALRPIAIE